jgi:predicted RNA-binding protein with PIN domain
MAEYLLVDGYNIIFSWPELNEFAENGNLDAARMKLMEMLSNYQGYYQNTVILVFDGYKVKNNPGTVEKYHNIYVVYTREAETADQYIEKTNGSLARSNQVRVATSDRLEQVIILGQGATRVSARELKKEMEEMKVEIRKDYLHRPQLKRNSFIDNLDPEMAAMLEKMRLTEDPKEPPAGLKKISGKETGKQTEKPRKRKKSSKNKKY